MSSPPKTSRGGGAYRVVALLAVVAVVTGGFAFWRYRTSEQHILSQLDAFRAQGKQLTVEQCVDEVVDWSRRCAAMLSMCQASGSRMMVACLMARDRTAYCQSTTIATGDTHFGYKECQARNATKGLPKKICATAYRVVDVHCRYLERRAQARRAGHDETGRR